MLTETIIAQKLPFTTVSIRNTGLCRHNFNKDSSMIVKILITSKRNLVKKIENSTSFKTYKLTKKH